MPRSARTLFHVRRWQVYFIYTSQDAQRQAPFIHSNPANKVVCQAPRLHPPIDLPRFTPQKTIETLANLAGLALCPPCQHHEQPPPPGRSSQLRRAPDHQLRRRGPSHEPRQRPVRCCRRAGRCPGLRQQVPHVEAAQVVEVGAKAVPYAGDCNCFKREAFSVSKRVETC